jgi:ABC-type glycerol-3-phosphate transport system substrate-binding protein
MTDPQQFPEFNPDEYTPQTNLPPQPRSYNPSIANNSSFGPSPDLVQPMIQPQIYQQGVQPQAQMTPEQYQEYQQAMQQQATLNEQQKVYEQAYANYDPSTLKPGNLPPIIKKKKKQSGATPLIVLSLIILLTIGGAVFVLTNGLKLSNIVDKSILLSKCEPNTALSAILPDIPHMNGSIFADLLNAYNLEKKASLRIEFQNRKYDEIDYYNTNIIEPLARDSGPDLFAVRNDDLPAYSSFATPLISFGNDGTAKAEVEKQAQAKNIAAITDYKKSFVDIAVQDTIIKDQLFGVPLYVDSLQLYYNKQILNQKLYPDPVKSWEDLFAQVKEGKLSREKSNGNGFDLSAISLGTGEYENKKPNILEYQDIIPLIMTQFGGTIYDSKTNSVDFQYKNGDTALNNNLVKAIEFYTNFRDNTKDVYSWNESATSNVDEFLQGRLVYMIGYKELANTIDSRTTTLNYKIAPLPQIDNNESSAKTTFGRFFELLMSRKLANKDNPEMLKRRACAEDFLNFLTTLPAQKRFAELSGMPSAHKAVITDQQKGDEPLRTFANGALFATGYYKPDVVLCERIWSQMIGKINNNQSKDQAINEAITAYNSAISAGPKIRRK